jgi:hypothetical protein
MAPIRIAQKLAVVLNRKRAAMMPNRPSDVRRRLLGHPLEQLFISTPEDRMDTLSHTPFTRRSVLRSAAGAGLAAAAVLPLTLLAGPAKASNYRGIVGVIKPRATDSSLVEPTASASFRCTSI